MRSRSIARWSAVCGILGPLVLVVLVGVASALRPGYSQISQFMSELGVGSNGILLDAAIILSSLLNIGFFMGLHLTIDEGRGSKLPVAFAVAGNAVEMIAGFSPCSAANCSVFDLHLAAFVTGALLVIVAFPLFAQKFRTDPRWQRYRGWTLVSFAVATVLFLALLVGQQGALVAWKGLLQRIVIGIYLIWVVVVAIHLFRIAGGPTAAAPPAASQA